MKKIRTATIIFISLVLAIVLPAQDESIKHEVSVNVKMLPLFAVHKDGSPVFDLQKDDLELTVNGKPFDIHYFKRYEFETSKIDKQRVKPEVSERMVFVIIDSMFNTNNGYKRSKEITIRMLEQAKEGDRFLVFENSPVQGLTHVGGPKMDTRELMARVNKLRRPMERWASQLHSSRTLSNNIDFTLEMEARLETDNWASLRAFHLQSEKLRYKYRIKHFSRMLSDFQYILKTITKPKVVFLISEGIASAAFKTKSFDRPRVEDQQSVQLLTSDELRRLKFQSVLVQDEKRPDKEFSMVNPFLFRYLNELVKSINYGGSMIYTVNPRRLNDTNDDGLSGEMSLRFLARESGGQYFSGSDPGEIAKRIDKNTSAYYEVAFYTPAAAGEDLQVDIRCKRDDIKVHTTNHTQRSRNYSEMDKLQKKMFALNVINGGGWSRHLGKVMPARYRKVKDAQVPDSDTFSLNVLLPREMKNQDLDIFLIKMDPDTREVDMEVVNMKAKDWVRLKLKEQKDKKQYFVIIEPEGTYCIFNKA